MVNSKRFFLFQHSAQFDDQWFSKESKAFDVDDMEERKKKKCFILHNSIWNWRWEKKEDEIKKEHDNNVPYTNIILTALLASCNLLAENKILHNLRELKSISKNEVIKLPKSKEQQEREREKEISFVNFIRWFGDVCFLNFSNPLHSTDFRF